MYLFIPGRHHILTDFQFKYLFSLTNTPVTHFKDVNGLPVKIQGSVQGIIFAVTSANHSGTKRNPIPFYLRAMMIQEFSKDLPVPCYVYGIDDVGALDNFAAYTLKVVRHQSEQSLDLTPENTLIVCSTPVMDMYERLGFQILPAELADRDTSAYRAPLPWDLVEQIGGSDEWDASPELINKLHISSYKIWKNYQLGQKVQTILNDPIIGDDGDITESRDYGSYVRQMDEIAEIKYRDTASYIQSGKIGDIGCAVGSWIKQACEDDALRESDFYGIELARQLFDICNQRKHNREFGNPNVFFAQKNAVSSLVFEEASMNTIHTSSLTHEIESYGSREDLLSFIKNRYKELAPGGVWINRDVIGPKNGDHQVYMQLNDQDGYNESFDEEFTDAADLAQYLNQLSTYTRFKRFARDFRRKENDQIKHSEVIIDGRVYIKLALKDAAEFMLTKDYTDNWYSEMHERFCFWSISDWKNHLEEAGFRVDSNSTDYTNPWIAENRFRDKVELFELVDSKLQRLDYPPTNALIVARKII